MSAVVAPLHPDLVPIAALLGTWRGRGQGAFPTIEPFTYGEQMTFAHVGDPFLVYEQHSWLLDDGAPLHLERGFLRPDEAGRLELALAHPLGLTEIAHGALTDGVLELATEPGGVGRTRTGMAVVALRRRYELDGDTLRYTLDMATEATPMIRHLEAELWRQA